MFKNLKRKLSITTLSLIGVLSMASFASAVTNYYAYMHFNNNTPWDATLTNVSWTGSYWPQFPATVSANTSEDATLKTVLAYGYSGFTMYPEADDNGTTQRCYFSININNGSGAFSLFDYTSAGTVSCVTANPSGRTINFTMDD